MTDTAILALIGLNVLFALSFYITYMTGQLSFGHAAFVSLGAYTAGILTTKYAASLSVALPAAILIGFVSGVIVGVLALRTRHVYLAILTFALMQILAYAFGQWEFVGGLHGLTGMSGIEFPHIILAACLVTALTWLLERSNLGLAMRAVKQDEIAAQLAGISATQLRLLSFGLGSAVAGLAGALYGHYNFYIDPYTFGTSIAVSIVFFAIVGGTQTWIGPPVGAIVLTLLPEYLRNHMSHVNTWRPAMYAATIILILAVRPEGLIRRKSVISFGNRMRALFDGSRSRRDRDRSADPPAVDSIVRVKQVRVSIHNLSKRFGGVDALSGVTIDIEPNAIFAVIGPNGAGKTTLFNVLTGVYRPTSGGIILDGEEITGLGRVRVARFGVARTFQNIRLFKEMTVLEHVKIAQYAARAGAVVGALHRQRDSNWRWDREIETVLDELGIWRDRNRLAVELPYATQRRVELARAVASRPRLLLLDEPTAGMDATETNEIAQVISHIRDRFGCTIILVEHDMSLVMRLSERIAVLNFGKIIAEGTPAEIQADAGVREAYLGQDAAVI